MAEVTATLVVNFTGLEGTQDATLEAEIDSRPEGFNNGKTTFAPGDSFAYLVYPGAGVVVTQNESSLGRVSFIDSGQISLTEDIQFIDSQESNVSRPIQSISSLNWIGRSLGGVTTNAGSKVIRASTQGVAIARVTYNTNVRAYRVSNMPTDPVGDGSDFSVLVVITGTFNG